MVCCSRLSDYQRLAAVLLYSVPKAIMSSETLQKLLFSHDCYNKEFSSHCKHHCVYVVQSSQMAARVTIIALLTYLCKMFHQLNMNVLTTLQFSSTSFDVHMSYIFMKCVISCFEYARNFVTTNKKIIQLLMIWQSYYQKQMGVCMIFGPLYI